MTDQTRILCFGDSLTWGWIPVAEGSPSSRYRFDERWTGVMAQLLGDGYEIIEEGLSGRVTNIDDPVDASLNGARYLPAALATHLPLDLVVIMLGTNDTKAGYRRTANDIATGVSQLIAQVRLSGGGSTTYTAPQVLIVSPPPLGKMPHPWFADMFAGGHETSRLLARAYANLASYTGVHFFDAGSVISTDGVDGLHFSPQNNVDLGRALAAHVRGLGLRAG